MPICSLLASLVSCLELRSDAAVRGIACLMLSIARGAP